ncbi:hypothetical protein VSDG_06384 [Cytospora chrysosperma]|uniref:Uncharacterized protein n=1 Tax=Cytospora chrysosperma TaxID=252740 RepID=A0A423VPL9_CYTCH|nr:hypothetical protein VSDG_06384 [Valsa sordida]
MSPSTKTETPEQRRKRLLKKRRCMEATWRPKIPEVHQIRDEGMRRREMDLSAQRNFPIWATYELMETWAESSIFTGFEGPNSKAKSHSIEASMPGAMNETYTHRTRIQSQPILGYLTQLLAENQAVVHRSWPRTFFRPFRPLIYFQPMMKTILAKLEEKWGTIEAHEGKHKAQAENDTEIDMSSQSDVHEQDPDTESQY